MSVQEIEVAIAKLSPEERDQLARWFAQYQADSWDAQIERDLESGRLEGLLKQVDAEYEAGKAKPL